MGDIHLLGDRKHTTRWIKIISNPKPWEILYLSYILTHLYSLHYFLITFKMQNCLTSFQRYCVIYNFDVIVVVYEKFTPWLKSTGSGIENTQLVGLKSYQPQTMGDLIFIICYNTTFLLTLLFDNL